MSRLVYAPTVHCVGSTVMHPEALEAWASDEGLFPTMMANDTRLGKLYEAIGDEADGLGVHASLDRLTEFAGRHCYRSWEEGRELQPYIDNIISSAHGSVLRHGTMVFAISGISRTLSLELIRHHVGADVSQESQRYVRADQIRFVVPPLMERIFKDGERGEHLASMFEQQNIRDLIDYEFWIEKLGQIAEGTTVDKKRILEAARSRLPNCSETRLVWTMNTNAMHNIIAARGSPFADLEIRRLAAKFLKHGKKFAPAIFADMQEVTADDGFPAVLTMQTKI